MKHQGHCQRFIDFVTRREKPLNSSPIQACPHPLSCSLSLQLQAMIWIHTIVAFFRVGIAAARVGSTSSRRFRAVDFRNYLRMMSP
jgi:hypothetical protein